MDDEALTLVAQWVGILDEAVTAQERVRSAGASIDSLLLECEVLKSVEREIEAEWLDALDDCKRQTDHIAKERDQLPWRLEAAYWDLAEAERSACDLKVSGRLQKKLLRSEILFCTESINRALLESDWMNSLFSATGFTIRECVLDAEKKEIVVSELFARCSVEQAEQESSTIVLQVFLQAAEMDCVALKAACDAIDITRAQLATTKSALQRQCDMHRAAIAATCSVASQLAVSSLTAI